MKRLSLLLLLAATGGLAQDSDQRRGSYQILQGFEVGYRLVSVAGSREMYRSSVNYSNGLRLLDGILRIHSRDGHGRFLDEITLTSSGAGGDPYQSSSLRLEKNRRYRYDLGFRMVSYHNQLAALSGGEHRANTERIFQSHDLTLFPQSRFQLLLGYDRNNQNGPALISENFDVRREEAFPRDRFFVFADQVRRLNNQWRAGVNLTAAGIAFSFLKGWDDYKEDTRHAVAGAVTTAGLLPRTLRRDDPVHGRTPFTRLNVHSDANRRFSVNGRLVYAEGERNFVLDENISSLNPLSGVAVTRQAFVLGRGQRIQGTGDLSLSWQPHRIWALSNTTSLHHTRITGDSAFVEMRTPASRGDPDRDEFFFSLLGIRILTNATDVNFRPTPRVGFYGGYHYAVRRVRSREGSVDVSGGPGDVPLYSLENTIHSGLAGVRLRPVTPFTAVFDVEHGRADRPFTPLSERRFHAETARAQWKRKAWLLTAGFRNFSNRNAAPPVLGILEGAVPSLHTHRSRQYSGSVAWTPPRRFALDAGYSRLELDTASGILNFPLPSSPLAAARRSFYVSRLHHGHATLRAEMHKRATLFAGYSIVKDNADRAGLRRPAAPFLPAYPTVGFDGTDLVTAYPLGYQSPQARLSIELRPKLSWNAGWQFYLYRERFSGLQNYRAHASYTSLRWAF